MCRADPIPNPCQFAAEGNLEALKAAPRSSLDRRDKNGLTPIILAIRSGHVEVAKWIIENSQKDLNYSTESKEALEKGLFEIFEAFQTKIPEYRMDRFLNDGLHTLLMAGHFDYIPKLLKMGAVPSRDVMKKAAEVASPQIFKALLAKCSKHDEDLLQDLLIKTAKSGAAEMIKCIIKLKEVKIDEVETIDNRSAVQWAARMGHLEALKVLVEAGADFNAVATYASALNFTIFSGSLECFIYLHEAGADITREIRGCTPLIDAAMLNQNEILKYIVVQPVIKDSIEERKEELGKALFYAVRKGNYENCKLLIELGANIEHEEPPGRTPLMEASLRQRMEIIKLLIESHANLDKKETKSGKTAVEFAEKPEVKEYLKSCADQMITA